MVASQVPIPMIKLSLLSLHIKVHNKSVANSFKVGVSSLPEQRTLSIKITLIVVPFPFFTEKKKKKNVKIKIFNKYCNMLMVSPLSVTKRQIGDVGDLKWTPLTRKKMTNLLLCDPLCTKKEMF